MPEPFGHIGLIGRPAADWAAGTLHSLAEVLQRHAAHVLAVPDIAAALKMAQSTEPAAVIAGSELVIVAGGDGSLLSVAWPLARASLPVTGINFGRLGFLADIAPDRVAEQLPRILAGKGVVDKRLLLRVTTDEQPAVQYDAATEDNRLRALNEVLLHAPEVAHLAEFEVFADDVLLYRIRADGIIVATPTGSTAYALSAGGSILSPQLPGLAIVPMLAHGPGSGSVVLPADCAIRIVSSGQTRLTVDGRQQGLLAAGRAAYIEREPKPLLLLHPSGQNFFARVRDKLGWGLAAAPPIVSRQPPAAGNIE